MSTLVTSGADEPISNLHILSSRDDFLNLLNINGNTIDITASRDIVASGVITEMDG